VRRPPVDPKGRFAMKQYKSVQALVLLLTVASLVLLAGCGGTEPDEAAPSLTFNGLLDATTLTQTRTLSGTTDPGATVSITVNDVDVPDGDIMVNTDGTWNGPVTLSPGSNLVTVAAADATGNQSLFSLALTYDAVSIETYTSPISTTSLDVSGLFDSSLANPALTVTLPDGTELDPPPTAGAGPYVDTWSASLTGLQEGENILEVSVDAPDPANPGTTSPYEVSVTINVDQTNSIASIDFDQTITKVVLPAQVVSGTCDPDSEVTITPLPIETLPIADSGGGVWTSTIENLVVGKNPLTATVTDPTSNLPTTTRSLLIVEQTPPLVENISPANNATGADVTGNIVVVFNEAMDLNTITATNLTLSDGGLVNAAVSYDPDTFTATIEPLADLAPATNYTVTVGTGVTDARIPANPLPQALIWNFTTAP